MNSQRLKVGIYESTIIYIINEGLNRFWILDFIKTVPKNTELRPDRIAAWPEKHKGDSEKKTPASRATIEASKRLQIDVQIDRHKIVSN